MAIGEPSFWAPDGSFRSPPPFRESSQSPTAKTAPPTNTRSPTQPTVWVLSASSMSSKETEPISRPVPRAITAAITPRLGANRYAISAPTNSVKAPSAPHKKASNMGSPHEVAAVESGRLFVRTRDRAAEDDDE